MEHEYQEWYNTIASYERGFKEWESRVDRIVKRYRDDSRTRNNPNARFNILWSNVQTITPAIFARLPLPDRDWETMRSTRDSHSLNPRS